MHKTIATRRPLLRSRESVWCITLSLSEPEFFSVRMFFFYGELTFVAVKKLEVPRCCCLDGAFTEEVERNCHFLAPGWNCVTHRRAPQGFPDTSQVLICEKKINLPIL
jgi:hypothetical protein